MRAEDRVSITLSRSRAGKIGSIDAAKGSWEVDRRGGLRASTLHAAIAEARSGIARQGWTTVARIWHEQR